MIVLFWLLFVHFVLVDQLVSHFLAKIDTPRDEWVRALRDAGVFCGPVLSYAELIEQPHVWQNGYLTEVEHPRLGRKITFGNPVIFHNTPATVPATAPELGEHTEEVLVKELGFSKEEAEDFANQGATKKLKKRARL